MIQQFKINLQPSWPLQGLLPLFLVISLGVSFFAAKAQANSRCIQLEKKLANAYNQKNQDQQKKQLRLKNEYNKTKRQFVQAKRQADRYKCYQKFLFFSLGVKNSRRCIALDRKIKQLRRKTAQLSRAYNQAISVNSQANARQRQRYILRQLATNNCGLEYERMARRNITPNQPNFQDAFNGQPGSRQGGYQGRGKQTYRTLCVRTCDGYYFPISFATSADNFANDQKTCQSRCAAPTELYIYSNPGGHISRMVSVTTGVSYTQLKNAGRYRKELVKGCSCKKSEFDPDLLAGRKQSKSLASQAPIEVPVQKAPKQEPQSKQQSFSPDAIEKMLMDMEEKKTSKISIKR